MDIAPIFIDLTSHGACVAATVALVEIVKRAFPELPERLYPATALVAGIGWTWLVHYAQDRNVDPISVIPIGFLVAFVASGVYTQLRTTTPGLRNLGGGGTP